MNKKVILISLLIIAVVYFGYSTLSTLKLDTSKVSQEFNMGIMSPLGAIKSKVIAASCAFTVHGSADEFATCTRTVNCCYGAAIIANGTSQCGGACTGTTSSYFVGSGGGGGNVTCQNHPTYGQPCTSAPNACGTTSTGTYDTCGICSATTPSVPSCSLTNACGQTVTGGMCNGVCTAAGPGNMNDSCISTFNVTTDRVNPNGSVEFSWDIVETPGVGSRCGFVDLTTPTPRPIPGLQNLDPGTDRVRISNIQVTTRFCLVCQFYDLVSDATLGDAAAHQWIRVIRIGEE